jgi:hypothetical protein
LRKKKRRRRKRKKRRKKKKRNKYETGEETDAEILLTGAPEPYKYLSVEQLTAISVSCNRA